MNMLKKDDRVYVSTDGAEIAPDLMEKLNGNESIIKKASDFIRNEHPHCAFFKSTHEADGAEYEKTTLYTPEGRLHVEAQKVNDSHINSDRYVKKEDQLDTLLFYLRDIEIKKIPISQDAGIDFLIMPNTPLAEFYLLVEKDLTDRMLKESDSSAKQIFSQLRRIYNEKIEILSDMLRGRVSCLLYSDVNTTGADADILEKWHFYYIRKAKLFK